VGTKVKMAVQVGVHDTLGQDCVAMNVNDLIVQGAEPLFFLDYIGIHKVDPAEITDIVKGVADGCELAGCALLGGETCEMPDVYAKGEYDLAGFAVGVCELKKIVDGERAEVDDVILGMASSGVHSNGYTLVRAIVNEAELDLGKIHPDLDDQRTLGEVLMTPTRIYAKPVVSVLGRYKVKQPVSAMAHITGGGLPGNLPRVLGACDARVERGSWPVPGLFRLLVEAGGVAHDEAHRAFNMGLGMVLVVDPASADALEWAGVTMSLGPGWSAGLDEDAVRAEHAVGQHLAVAWTGPGVGWAAPPDADPWESLDGLPPYYRRWAPTTISGAEKRVYGP